MDIIGCVAVIYQVKHASRLVDNFHYICPQWWARVIFFSRFFLYLRLKAMYMHIEKELVPLPITLFPHRNHINSVAMLFVFDTLQALLGSSVNVFLP